jgi:hypothetical protein
MLDRAVGNVNGKVVRASLGRTMYVFAFDPKDSIHIIKQFEAEE